MDFQRLFLFLVFSFSLLLVWDGWQRYQHPQQASQQAVLVKPDASVTQEPGLTTIPTTSPRAVEQIADGQQPNKPANGQTIHVRTDTVEAEINTIGGNIERLAFLQQPDAKDKDKPFELFQIGRGTHNYMAQSGLLGAGMPNHNSLFTAEQDHYELANNAEELKVRLVAEGVNGIKVVKTVTFRRGSYLINLNYEIENNGPTVLNSSAYFQMIRDGVAPEGATKFVPTYTGAAVYTENEKLKKVDFSAIDKAKTPYPKQADNGWIGILQHYFVAAWLPQDKTSREFFTRKLEGEQYSVGIVQPIALIAPGQKTSLGVALYAGPADSNLDKIAPGLGLSVDYGWLTIISAPLFWLMSKIHLLVNNWGIAIILLTFLIKLAFFPLSAASYRSMAKMRVVAPKLEKIKQQYGDDREQLNRAMMELYKTEKINPLGGCLPMLIQIPVFIGLYWAILESVELRYAPFFGWITNLSVADPYYVLPLIMGASMLIQTKLNPKPPDPIQAKVMQIMPIAFSVIFFFFPAGLVLYSIVNNALSIAQQWFITRKLEGGSSAAKR